jgi:hypothetical protein
MFIYILDKSGNTCYSSFEECTRVHHDDEAEGEREQTKPPIPASEAISLPSNKEQHTSI